jgi:hypothetical protein
MVLHKEIEFMPQGTGLECGGPMTEGPRLLRLRDAKIVKIGMNNQLRRHQFSLKIKFKFLIFVQFFAI